LPFGVMNSRCVLWKTPVPPSDTLQDEPIAKREAESGFVAARETAVAT